MNTQMVTYPALQELFNLDVSEYLNKIIDSNSAERSTDSYQAYSRIQDQLDYNIQFVIPSFLIEKKEELDLIEYSELRRCIEEQLDKVVLDEIQKNLNNEPAKELRTLSRWTTENNHKAHITYNNQWYCGYISVDNTSPLHQKQIEQINGYEITFADLIDNKWTFGIDKSSVNKHATNNIDSLTIECERLSSLLAEKYEKNINNKWVSKDKYIEQQNELKNKLTGVIDVKFDDLFNKLGSKETEDEIKNFLKFSGQFHNYSFLNTLLIQCQAYQKNIEVERVAKSSLWRGLKNKEGEKAKIKQEEYSNGFQIFRPIFKTKYLKDENGNHLLNSRGKWIPELDQNGNKKQTIAGFKLGNVYDVSQTNAIEIDAYTRLQYRTKSESCTESFFQELKKEISSRFDLSITEHKMRTTLGGYYDAHNDSIAINNTSSRTVDAKISTLMHELGHHIMHKDEILNKSSNYDQIHTDRGLKEGQAESFAYVMSSILGIENKSELYIKHWGNDAGEMRSNLAFIKKASGQAIDKLQNILFKNAVELNQIEELAVKETQSTRKKPGKKYKTNYKTPKRAYGVAV